MNGTARSSGSARSFVARSILLLAPQLVAARQTASTAPIRRNALSHRFMAGTVKKFVRKLRAGANEQPTTQSSTTQSNARFPPTLQVLADRQDRFGLHFIPPLPVQASNAAEGFDLDIIAVHGLGGDFFNTWTKISNSVREQDVFWLSQLLPATLPGARIYSFGYDSKPAFSKSVAKVRDFSKQLLEHLLAQSLPDKRRPMIFICHSLGGIVVKQAMITAHESQRFAEVLRMTRAIMFMGTPHRGSDVAASLSPLIYAINFGLKYSAGSRITGLIRDDLVKLLIRNSDALDEINESFMPRAKNMHITSFYETRFAENLNQVVVSKQSAVLQTLDEDLIPLTANHMSMCRFSSLSESNYQLVSNALKNIARLLSRNSGDLSSKSAESLHSLTASERRYTSYFEREVRPNQKNERIEGTCKWLLDTPQYRAWEEDQDPAILWITGDAGCGKTTLISFMTEVLSSKASQKKTGSLSLVMAFFCAKDVSACNDGRSIACGLIISILNSRRNVIRRVKAEFAPIKQEFGQSLEHLWNVLMFALDVASCDRYYIVIDALDECQAESRGKLLTCIGRMLDSYKDRDRIRYKRIKLLFTSQPQTMTEWRALDYTSDLYNVKIEDRPSGMTQDVLALINHKVDQLVQLRRYDSLFAQELKKALHQKAQNSFLWISLALTYMETTFLLHANDPWQLLANLPSDLKEVYAKYLPSPRPQNAATIRKCVQLLVASCRTLTLGEIEAFTNTESPDRHPATPQKLAILQNSLELMFGSLVRFPDHRVDLVHSTVKDFFLDMGQDTTAMAKTYGTDIIPAHLTLAEACINYLLHEDFSIDYFKDIEPSSAATETSLSPIDASLEAGDTLTDIFDIQDVTFLKDEGIIDDEACSHIRTLFAPFDYAATNWAYHFALCEHTAPETLIQKVRLLSQPKNVQVSNWYKYMANRSSTLVPSFNHLDELLLATMFDHCDALRSLLSLSEAKSDVFEARCQLGLFWAASRGHSRSVQVLLEHGTQPNFLENGQSPLIVAVLGGYQNVCKVLLQTRTVDPNFSDKSSRSPLIHAVASDQHDILSMLLSHESILVDASDRFGFTPLLEAALSGCLHCLRCLKSDKRSDFTKCDKKGRNVLSYAACTESFASVHFILKNLASEQVHKCDSFGRTAISYAAERSHLPIVKRLLESNISVSQGDNNGRNAISWAVSRPYLVAQKDEENTVLQFIVSKFPQEADVKDKFGWTPLAWAMNRPGDLNSVKILVEVGGVDINQQDWSGRPVLSWAASEGFENITRYLLQVPGVNKNTQDFSGRTPISHAAASGSLAVVRLLLASEGIDPSIADNERRSPSDWARLNHHDEIVRELSFFDST